jgi:hypothetical protein
MSIAQFNPQPMFYVQGGTAMSKNYRDFFDLRAVSFKNEIDFSISIVLPHHQGRLISG